MSCFNFKPQKLNYNINEYYITFGLFVGDR